MSKNIGTLQEQISSEIYELFQPIEGTNNVYYGKVRNGKTYAATCDILELLRRGEIVYANWDINFEGFDERNDFQTVFFKFLLRKKYFYEFDKANFHYFHPDSIDIKLLGSLVGVHVFIDEGQWIFNSHIRNPDPEARKLILHGGHYCRSLNVITQRPQNIFLDIRSQINVWYKCEKRFSFGRWILFQRWHIEDMKDNLPDDEAPEGRPKTYWGDEKVFAMYNTHGMRAKDAISEPPKLRVFETSFWDRVKLVLSFFVPVRWLEPRTGRKERKLAVQSRSERSIRNVTREKKLKDLIPN